MMSKKMMKMTENNLIIVSVEDMIELLNHAIEVCYDAGDVDEAIGYIQEVIDMLEGRK